ncbi:MAG TPA: hypothetical protein VES97_07790, partial [Solirubrobacteraceae bacterium]|nr:hypothetical protein [Solirubrobacteraceae bacterium]
DTRWYQAIVRRATAICFIAGRLSFVQPDGARAGTAGAPSALLAFGLPCALALSQSRLGQTLVLPGETPPTERRDELDEHRSLRL